MSALLTTAVMLGVAGLPVGVGLIVARILAWDRRWSSDDWLDAPLLGIATIIILLQNAAYAGFPLRTTAWPFLGLMLLGAIVLGWFGHWRGVLRACPKAVFLIALLVLAIQGLGLWTVGIRAYTGRAWNDEINYGIVAQYLVDRVYGVPLPPHDPVGLIGAYRAQSRIGQSTLQGFFSVLFPLGVKALFEPTILLGPLWVSVALAASGIRARLPFRLTLSLAALGGVLPAIASIHLESFLSQAVALPGLLYLPVMLDRATESRSWGDFLRASLVMAATTAIYLEFFLPLEVCVLIFFVTACFQRGRRQQLPALAIVAAAPFLFGITRGLAGTLLDSFGRPGVLAGLYPWAFSLEGLERLWAGDLVGNWWAADGIIARGLAVSALVVGYVGLLRQLEIEIAAAAAGSPQRIAASLCMFAFAILPMAILVRDFEHPYQFYKLLMSVAPLVAWGIGYALWSLPVWLREPMRSSLAVAGVLVATGVAASGTVAMARESTEHRVFPRQNTIITLDPGFLAIEQELRETANRDIISCLSEPTPPQVTVNGWLTLFASRNRTWVLNPYVNDNYVPSLVADYFRQIPGLLVDPIILTSTTQGAVWARLPNAPQRTNVGDSFSLVMPRHEPFALVCGLTLSPGNAGAGQLVVPPEGVDLMVYSNLQGPATIALHAAPDDPAYTRAGLQLTGEREPTVVPSRANGVIAVPVRMMPGATPLHLVAPLRRDRQRVVAEPVELLLAEFQLLSSVKRADPPATTDAVSSGAAPVAPTTIEIFSPVAGTCLLTFDTARDTGSDGAAAPRLRVRSGTTHLNDVASAGGTVTISLPVAAGWTDVQIEPIDSPGSQSRLRDRSIRPIAVEHVTARLDRARN